MKAKILPLLILSTLIWLLSGCGRPEPTQTPENAPGSITISIGTVSPTETPLPTSTPVPTPTPQIIFIEVTPTPTPILDGESTGDNGDQNGQDNGEPDQSQATNTPSPPPTPTVPATPRDRPAQPPTSVGNPAFSFSVPPTRNGDNLSLSAVVESQSLEPTQVQVFSALRIEDINGGKCTTDRPIAFISTSAGSGATDWQWAYCGNVANRPLVQVSAVPWVAASNWSYTLRPRNRLTSPFIYDWDFSVDLNDPRVQYLDYPDRAGWIVIIWGGPHLLAKVWVAN